MREVQPGVWHWTGQHPDWSEGQDWGPEVSSYAIDEIKASRERYADGHGSGSHGSKAHTENPTETN